MKKSISSEPASLLHDRWLLASIGVVVFAAAALIAVFFFLRRGGATPAPAFALRDQQGRLTSLAQFRGKVVVLAFIDPDCREICPLTTQSMVEAMRLLGPAASQVQLLGINVNPQATQVSDVANYTRVHQMQGQWRFLTGSVAQLKQVWSDYHVYVGMNPQNGNDIVHEAIVYLIGRNGSERKIYSTPMSFEDIGQQAHQLAEGIAGLLPAHPAVEQEASQEATQPLKPTETFQFPAVGPHPKTVAVGGTHPHLLLFFAGWLQENSDLPASLASLDQYAATAQKQGWPAPVAIDELPTEGSPAAAQQMLVRLATTLHTPTIKDADGRLADGYGVEGLPWFVLTSSSGQILWHHEGWLAAPALEQHIRTALAGKTPQ